MSTGVKTGRKIMAITGFGVLSGAGLGPEALARSLSGGAAPADISALFDDPLPRPDAYAVPGFDVRTHLGRKGTSFFDRNTALGLVACREALADGDREVTDATRSRFGITLGTTHASLKSTSDYSRDTFVEKRPYLVNPVLFPNAVMNCTAGQAGIWYGTTGPNTTVAGGPLAMLQVLRYGRVLLGCGRADVLLAGAMEELSPQTAWAVHYEQRAEGGSVPSGEGAAVFLLEDAEVVRARGGRVDAEVLAVELAGFDPPGAIGGDFVAGLARCLRSALEAAGVSPADVATVATAANGMTDLDDAEQLAVSQVLGDVPVLRIKEVTGEAGAASGALQLAALLARHRAEPERDGQVSVITNRSADGGAGVAVIRGWSRS